MFSLSHNIHFIIVEDFPEHFSVNLIFTDEQYNRNIYFNENLKIVALSVRIYIQQAKIEYCKEFILTYSSMIFRCFI